MNFTRWAQSHARSILFLIIVLAIGGAVSGWNLPVALFPHVHFPRVRVSVDAGNRPAERMAVEVTYPVEEALRAIPGVRHIRSTTSRGSNEISVTFDWGADMVQALLQAQSELTRVLPSLPPGTTFEVARMDPTVFPAIAYSLTSPSRCLVELRDFALYQLRPILSTIPGVAKITVQGGASEEYRVIVDPAKLQSFGLTIGEVAKELSASNVLHAVGHMQDHNKLYLVVSDTRFKSLEEIAGCILRSGTNGVLRVKDVAEVRDDTAPQFIRVTADGRDAVIFQIYQQPGANTVQIAADAKAQLAGLGDKLPAGIKLSQWYDQSDLIVASAKSVSDAVLIGAALAAFVLFAFLRNWKITLIALLALPASLAATILLLKVLGMSFNIMTLGGMAAAVGLIIDDSIVMVEHIVRRLRGGSGHEYERVILATAEFTRPLAGSSASTIIIFLPLAFLSGVTGAFFKALSLTMAASLILSFLIAWLAVPILAGKLLGKKDAEQAEGGAFTRWVHRGYERLMRRVLAHPWLIVIGMLLLAGSGWFASSRVGSGFMPTMDEGGFILDYVAAPGTSLTETDRWLVQIEAILQTTPEVATYSRRTGLQLGGGLSEANIGDFFVRLKPLPRRSIDAIMNDVRGQIGASVPGLEVELLQLMEDLIGDLTAVPQPIEIKLFTDDAQLLLDTAPKVAEALARINGVVGVKNGIIPAGDALIVEVDRVKAALDGLDSAEITSWLDDFLAGNLTTNVLRGPKLVGVRVWTPKNTRRSARDLREFQLRAPDGHLVPLSRVATIKTVTGQPEINREDLKRMAAVTARITGRDLGSTLADVKLMLDNGDLLPTGVYYSLGGLYEQQRIAFRGMLVVMIAAIVLVFLLLLFLYESFRVALAMLATPLLALPAVFLGLWLTATELNITSIMGMTMVLGIVGEVAIFFVSEVSELASAAVGRECDFSECLVLAGKNRMRPIAMTTFAAILALLPLALGIGQGSAMQQPLAIAITAGLLAQLPLTLIVLPALLLLIKGRPSSVL
ncbi:MAG: efflux RND transporter permease subunit [Verrucomicrobia bacterium]|nr:MAG: efflux RND transporter permease subunit [Verrucomicrobiota bacterium]